MSNLENDPINPNHYKSHPSGVECIDITEHFPFNIGNAIKYLWRAGLKAGTSIIEDLEKAKWYVSREITRVLTQNPDIVDDINKMRDAIDQVKMYTDHTLMPVESEQEATLGEKPTGEITIRFNDGSTISVPADSLYVKDPLQDREVCQRPPKGWHCTRNSGHDGPCAAIPVAKFYAMDRDIVQISGQDFIRVSCVEAIVDQVTNDIPGFIKGIKDRSGDHIGNRYVDEGWYAACIKIKDSLLVRITHKDESSCTAHGCGRPSLVQDQKLTS